MKRRTRQRLVRGAMYGVFVLGVVVLALVADWGRLATNFANLEIASSMFPEVVTTATG